ncbi:MAG: hypothetical protein K6G88_06475 [Lachnospiraceae bacterium]|nr:hypothetical protein [Lachnospiraceae bacterium]
MLEQFSFIGLKKITLKSDNVGQDGITFFTTKLPFVFVNTGKGSGTLEVGQGVDFWDNYY